MRTAGAGWGRGRHRQPGRTDPARHPARRPPSAPAPRGLTRRPRELAPPPRPCPEPPLPSLDLAAAPGRTAAPRGRCDPAPRGCARRAPSSPRAAVGPPWNPHRRPPGPRCPDAGATLPAAAACRPRGGHAGPTPKEEARYEAPSRVAGWVPRAQAGLALGIWAQCPTSGPLAPPGEHRSYLTDEETEAVGHPAREPLGKRDQEGSPGREGASGARCVLPGPIAAAVWRGRPRSDTEASRTSLGGPGIRRWRWWLRSRPNHQC